MHLMDDIAPWPPVEEEVIKVDGWIITLLKGGTDIDQYRITHSHKGYDWGVNTITISEYRGRVGCIHCGKEVPKEALGFLELLKWEK